MGYYTKFTLDYELPENSHASLRFLVDQALERDGTCTYGKIGIFIDGNGGEPCKWYEYRSDMIRFSKEFPDVVFSLKGEGEESGDLWIEYFKGGLTQVCRGEVVYPEYDESKLEVPD